MTIGQEHYITSWFRIAFIENEGMAFGLTLGSKLFLTLFRIVAMGGARLLSLPPCSAEGVFDGLPLLPSTRVGRRTWQHY